MPPHADRPLATRISWLLLPALALGAARCSSSSHNPADPSTGGAGGAAGSGAVGGQAGATGGTSPMDAGTDADAGSPEPTLLSTHVGKEPADQHISDVSISPKDGHIFVSGYRAGAPQAAFVAEFEIGNPTEIGRLTFPSPAGNFFLLGMEADGNGEIEISGMFSKDVTIGSKTWTEAGPDFGGIMARVIPSSDGGASMSSLAMTGAGDQSFWGNARLGAGTVAVGGVAKSTIWSGKQISADDAGDAIVASEFQGSAALQTHAIYGGAGKQMFFGVAVSTTNDICAVGESSKDGQQLQVIGAGTNQLATMVCFDSSMNLKWARALGSTLNDSFFAAAADPISNSLVAVGQTTGAITLGSGPALAYAGSEDILVARFDAGGTLEWARTFGGGADDRAYSVAIAADGDIFVAGHVKSASIDFGTGQLAKNGSSDGFLLRLDSTGSVRWASLIGGPGDDMMGRVAFGSGKLAVAGRFQGSFELLGKTVTGTPDAGALFDIGVLVFQP